MEERIKRLEVQLASLQAAFIQSQKNQVPITGKVDDTANRVTEITPWTATKTAYIGDTECIFTDVPQGNLTVYLTIPYTVERMDNRVTVRFDTLEEVTDIAISII
jgi:hypothetical protein